MATEFNSTYQKKRWRTLALCSCKSSGWGSSSAKVLAHWAWHVCSLRTQGRAARSARPRPDWGSASNPDRCNLQAGADLPGHSWKENRSGWPCTRLAVSVRKFLHLKKGCIFCTILRSPFFQLDLMHLFYCSMGTWDQGKAAQSLGGGRVQGGVWKTEAKVGVRLVLECDETWVTEERVHFDYRYRAFLCVVGKPMTLLNKYAERFGWPPTEYVSDPDNVKDIVFVTGSNDQYYKSVRISKKHPKFHETPQIPVDPQGRRGLQPCRCE